MTAKDADGREIYRAARHYQPPAVSCLDEKMAYGAPRKSSSVRDTSLQPGETRSETFEVKLPEGVRTADVMVELNYEIQNPENRVLIHRVTRTVTLDR